MRKAKISFMHGPHDLRIEEVDVADPKPNQVLVRVKAAGICGSDVHCFDGDSSEGRYDIAPYTPGHEWAGEAAEVGKNVTTIKVGDKVTGDCVLACFHCENCKRGLMPAACLNFREVGFRPDSPGGMGEYLLLDEDYVHPLPQSWTYEEGALVEPFSIGYYGVWGPAGWVDASDDVVIFGSGTIGLTALIVCKTAGAKVIVFEPLANRREMAKYFGADVVLDPFAVDVKAEVAANVTSSQGATVVVEASGDDKAIADCFDVTGLQPRLRLIGHSVGRKVPAEIGLTIWKGIVISGQGGTSFHAPRTITFMDRIRDRVDLTKLISHRYPFEKINDAFNMAVNKRAEAVKVMLTF
jgi:L-iditol 2-dehydrogenase